jgi:hypothetical protein
VKSAVASLAFPFFFILLVPVRALNALIIPYRYPTWRYRGMLWMRATLPTTYMLFI